MSKLNKILILFVFVHLFFLGIALFYMSVTSLQINRIDISSISPCFDNFDEGTVCVLDRSDGKIHYTTAKTILLRPSDLVLIGDSHSIPIFMLLFNAEKLLEKYERVIYAGVSSCFPFSGFVHSVKNRIKRCEEIYELSKTHHGDLGLALFWSSYLLEEGSNFQRNFSFNFNHSFPNAQSLILFEEKPSFSVDPRAMRNFQSPFTNVETNDYQQLLFDVRSKMEIGDSIRDVQFLNLYESLCDDKVCSMVIYVDGSPVWAYADEHHLSRDGFAHLLVKSECLMKETLTCSSRVTLEAEKE